MHLQQVSYPMNTYISGVDAAISSIQKDRQKDVGKALLGFLSVRFTSSTPATLSMAYSNDASPAGGRSYLEIFSLSEFYDSLQTYDDIVKPIQEQSIGTFLVWAQAFLYYCQVLTDSISLGAASLGSVPDTRIHIGAV